jgi:hypothetical protein
MQKICVFKENRNIYYLSNPSAVSTKSTGLEIKEM